MSNTRVEKITQLLTEAFHPGKLKISDDSHKHIGHAGASAGGGHFRVTICSEKFKGLSAVKKHQLIYQALESMMTDEIHALSISASAEEQT
ncbi:MAG TPA: BolA family transcriptional regulator [Aeromonadales bacterium]|nr:BolA family transcriptional regulator [Aeromonadales bacterium]